MANTKISDLTDGGDAQSTDRFAIARDPTGSSLSRWTDTAGIFAFIKATNGTISADWTFSSAALIQGSGTAVDAASSLAHGAGDGTLHVHTASAGSITAAADYDDLVVENSGNAGISVLAPASGYSSIVFGDPDDADIGYIKYHHGTGTDSMFIGTNAADRITILSDGKTGIGTGSPDGKLHVMTSDASTSANANADDLVVEVNGTGGISILSSTTGAGNIFFGDTDNDVGYIQYDHNGADMKFVVETNEIMRADSAGVAVGAGVDEDPGADLHVKNSDSGVSPVGEVFIESSAGTVLTLASGATSNSIIGFSDSTGGANEGYVLYNHNTNRLVLKSAAVESLILDEQGTLNVAENGSHSYLNSDFHALEQSGGSGSVCTVIECSAAMDNLSSIALETRVGGTRRATIYGNGNGYNVNDVWGTYSDRRLKENIQDAGSQLEDILKVKLRKFNLREDKQKKPHLGVIAQELEAISPGMVDETSDPQGRLTKTVKSSLFIYKLIGAVQELAERIEKLEANG